MTRYIDNTILERWKKCRLAAWLTYGKGMDAKGHAVTAMLPTANVGQKRPNLKLLWGTAAHEMEAVWLNTQDKVKAALQFETVYRAATTPPPEDDRYAWENSRDIIAAYLYHQGSLPSTFTPVETWVERHLEVPLKWRSVPQDDGATLGTEPEIVFVSRPDAIGTVAGQNGLYTRETKTTGQRLGEDWASQWQKSSQLTSQMWAVSQATASPLAGSYVNAIAVTHIPDASTRACRAHKVPLSQCRLNHAVFHTYGPFTRSPEAVDTWRTLAIELAEEFFYYADRYDLDAASVVPEDGQFDASGACRFCDWRGWCVGGKDPTLIPRVAVYNPWDPRVGAKSRTTPASGP